jgi:hypothetical protein
MMNSNLSVSQLLLSQSLTLRNNMPPKTKPPSERRNRSVIVLLTDEEMSDLDQVVAEHNRTIHALGMPEVITRANFIRNLIQKETAKLHEPPEP